MELVEGPDNKLHPISLHVLYRLTVSICDKYNFLLLDFSLSVKAATLIFISGCGSAISSA